VTFSEGDQEPAVDFALASAEETNGARPETYWQSLLSRPVAVRVIGLGGGKSPEKSWGDGRGTLMAADSSDVSVLC
jgi:hypothetical protein